MGTGYRGTFVISWSQTEVDGLDAAPVQNLNVGAAWAWRGDAIRVDGPSDILRLDKADGAEELRRRAARMVHRLVGAALDVETMPDFHANTAETPPVMDNSFVVTDGARSYTVTLIEIGRGSRPLLMFMDAMPPRNIDLWIVHHTLGMARQDSDGTGNGGVICFTPGTLIRTPDGTSAIEDLREGDLVQTKDSGAQPLQWIGSRKMSGARLFAMPHLRPIRFRADILGPHRPDANLLVSPEHKILLTADVAQELFNTSEVLVAAKDLVNGTSIATDFKLREVTYIHVLLEQHQVMWANGVETESFHPSSASLGTLGEVDRARLLSAYPELEFDPHAYGSFARRTLSSSEAAILTYAA